MKIAVLLATFNRKAQTLSCLQRVYLQSLPTGTELVVFMTDDNSSDGTAETVANYYPQVNLLKGTGNLFWAGGMRNSWTAALKVNPDYFLLLNDDTLLAYNAIDKLLNYYDGHRNQPTAITIGSTFDVTRNEISYGGRKLYNQKKVQSYPVFSETEYMECDLANANIMMVPKQIVQQLGILSDRYTHSIADFDYTLTAKKAGFKNMVIPGILGNCIDDHGNNWKSSTTSLRDRIRYLKSPKGLAYHEYLGFIKLHFPLHVPEAFVKLWIKTLFPVLWDKFKR
ncbi:glycosyltransferase family 2 protein [Pedobacter heparinus]|uniref:glycosyltransferase family 2 protein n=1 Tax=Pedobacter heparinus TaxID=984 RepID=UPI00292FFFC3|nr:glycosyltransferase family 2 protein [Pedobacter heparinus]